MLNDEQLIKILIVHVMPNGIFNIDRTYKFYFTCCSQFCPFNSMKGVFYISSWI